jgi:hypothetical protein
MEIQFIKGNIEFGMSRFGNESREGITRSLVPGKP